MVIVANDPGSDDGRERRSTRLIDNQGEVLRELDVGIDEPSVVAADPTHSSFVIGDGYQLVGFQITGAE